MLELNTLAEIQRLCTFKFSNKTMSLRAFSEEVLKLGFEKNEDNKKYLGGEWKLMYDNGEGFKIHNLRDYYVVSQGIFQSIYKERKPI